MTVALLDYEELFSLAEVSLWPSSGIDVGRCSGDVHYRVIRPDINPILPAANRQNEVGRVIRSYRVVHEPALVKTIGPVHFSQWLPACSLQDSAVSDSGIRKPRKLRPFQAVWIGRGGDGWGLGAIDPKVESETAIRDYNAKMRAEEDRLMGRAR